MKEVNVNYQLVEIYLRLLATLNRESKLLLFERFSQEIAQEKAENSDFFALFGALKNKESAEDMIEDIRSQRVFNRIIEPL